MKRREEEQHNRYERKVATAEANEEAMLRRVHKLYTVEGTPVDLNIAAKIVWESAQDYGWSFHETLYMLNYSIIHNTLWGRW